MIIASDVRGHYLKFNDAEWSKLMLDRKPLSRLVGWSAGWFRLDVKLTKIPDPFKEDK
jgi:hypothetical protein